MTAAPIDNDSAQLLIAASRAELMAAGLPADDRTVCHLLACRLLLATRDVSPGYARMAPVHPVRAPKVQRPVVDRTAAEMEG